MIVDSQVPHLSLVTNDADITSARTVDVTASRIGRLFEPGAFWLLIAILAWAPFPLGSNRPWSWSLLMLLISVAWLSWAVSICSNVQSTKPLLLRLVVPIGLASVALLWGVVQVVPFVPLSWVHPVWMLSADALGHPVRGTISLDPWGSGTALMKLGACAMTFWLVAIITQKAERALLFLKALMFIGAGYATYALVLGLLGVNQFQLFYDGGSASSLAGPFVSRNNFATFMGLAALCSAVRFVSLSRNIVIDRGVRALVMTVLQYMFGFGALPAVAMILTFSMVVASGSRAGFLAVLIGMIALLALASAIARRRLSSYWGLIGIFILGALGGGLFLLNGSMLQERFLDVAGDNVLDDGRATLWAAALRMIEGSPWLGLGIGTFEKAYPLYTDHVLPFVMDKAHNDYLELAAGLGLPAAILWLGSLLWLTLVCIRGVFVRRRNQGYPILAVGATALVGFHSIFDFSLQIPAIAVTYAAILGLGVSQSFSTRSA